MMLIFSPVTVHMNNSTRNTSSITPVAIENMDNFYFKYHITAETKETTHTSKHELTPGLY